MRVGTVAPEGLEPPPTPEQALATAVVRLALDDLAPGGLRQTAA